MIIYKIVTEILGSLKHYVDDLIILFFNHPTKVEMMEARKQIEVKLTKVTRFEPDLLLISIRMDVNLCLTKRMESSNHH